MMMYGHADNTDQMRILDKALLADVLLLDDLGAEKASDWTRKELVIILDERYRENRPTIVTSNLMLTDGELRNTCGARAYSRLCSDHFKAVALTAADYRRKQA
jgi:DNA replication protein DnaC